jgi:hypothetical protein
MEENLGCDNILTTVGLSTQLTGRLGWHPDHSRVSDPTYSRLGWHPDHN